MPGVVSQMWHQLSALGSLEPHALDTTALTLDATVTHLRLAVAQRSLLLSAR